MSGMFTNCKNFNQPLNFNTSNVEDMSNMFWYCTTFNQPINFNTSKVEDMYLMFQGCKSLDKTNINFINQKQNTQKQEEILSI
ncbi:BspA family leucine-rich repeat surface protein [Mycoplasma anserisalpingitidis]|nr:BspA family leucine-rich repeat surface protein [Mycoplasma anserisalpingitidis]